MPITTSAKKALRGSKRKRVFNLRRKSTIDDLTKDLRKLIAAKDSTGAEKLMPSVYKALDKAAKIGYIKANTASRFKSRSMKALKKLSTSK